MSNVSYPGAVSGITTSGIVTTTTVARTITTVATAATCGTSTWATSTMVASTVQSATALRPAVPFYQEHSNGAPRKVIGLRGPHINTNHTTDRGATVASAVKRSATTTAAVQRSATATAVVQRSATVASAVKHSATSTAAVQRNAIVASPIRRASAVASPVRYDNQPVPAVSPVSSTSKNRSGVIRRSKAASPLRSTATHLGTASNRADPVSTPPRATVTATDYP
ncbi:AGAP012725-PA, partial [Anopheles gambiae str. PEST]